MFKYIADNDTATLLNRIDGITSSESSWFRRISWRNQKYVRINLRLKNIAESFDSAILYECVNQINR